MTLTLTITPEKQTRLAAQARRAGLPLDRYVQQIIDQAAEDAPPAADAPRPPLSPTRALFAQWEADDPVTDEADRARRQQDGDALLDSLRENRLTLRIPHLSGPEKAA